jgi:hypothetical protein
VQEKFDTLYLYYIPYQNLVAKLIFSAIPLLKLDYLNGGLSLLPFKFKRD